MKLRHPLAAFATLAFCLSHHSATAADAKGWLLVTNKGDQTLSMVDPATNQQVATIPEGGNTGHELAASPDGKRAFVPIYSDVGVGKAGSDGQLVRVMDLDKRAV